MSGEILYQYLGTNKKPLREADIDLFVTDTKDFLRLFKVEENNSQNIVAKRINKKRNNGQILSDIYETVQELLLRLDSSKIIDKDRYRKKLLEIVGLMS